MRVKRGEDNIFKFDFKNFHAKTVEGGKHMYVCIYAWFAIFKLMLVEMQTFNNI